MLNIDDELFRLAAQKKETKKKKLIEPEEKSRQCG